MEKNNFGSGEAKTEGWGGYGSCMCILGTRQLKEWACVSERIVLAQEQVDISEVGINSGSLLEKENIGGGISRSCFQSESSGQKPNCSREAPFLRKGSTDSVWLQGLDPNPVVPFSSAYLWTRIYGIKTKLSSLIFRVTDLERCINIQAVWGSAREGLPALFSGDLPRKMGKDVHFFWPEHRAPGLCDPEH